MFVSGVIKYKFLLSVLTITRNYGKCIVSVLSVFFCIANDFILWPKNPMHEYPQSVVLHTISGQNLASL
jgi:hypothetical protein